MKKNEDFVNVNFKQKSLFEGQIYDNLDFKNYELIANCKKAITFIVD